jgi:SAM-dependent methyltransferase
MCGHGQLGTLLDPDFLFGDYLYASSTSATLARYQDWFAGQIAGCIFPGSQVLEIACNDGLLLNALQARGIDCLGVEPSDRMAERARLHGHHVVDDFWPAASTRLGDTKFDVILGQNVLAHTPHPLDFMKACKAALMPDGVAVMQTSQADMVENGEFDTIYHEHYSFFCEDSAEALGGRAGFTALATRYASVHGESHIFFFGNDQVSLEQFLSRWDETATGSTWLSARSSLSSPTRASRSLQAWTDFAFAARHRMIEVQTRVAHLRASGHRVVAVGAAAKGITFLRASEVVADCLMDEAQDKIGRYVDGLDLEIAPLAAAGLSPTDAYIMTAWNFAAELAGKLLKLGASREAPVLTYFPQVTELTLADFE